MSHSITHTIAVGLTALTVTIAGTIFAPAQAAQQLSCTGKKANGWSYNAQFVDGRFTQIIWNRSGQPQRVSPLTFYRNNAQGEPIYRGSFQGATAVTLIDLGRGNVRPGSQISVGVEEWGWSRGTCGTTSGSGGSTDWFSNLQTTIIGNPQWRDSMRSQGFTFVQTMQETNTQIVERWIRSSDRATVDVVIMNNQATDIRRVS